MSSNAGVTNPLARLETKFHVESEQPGATDVRHRGSCYFGWGRLERGLASLKTANLLFAPCGRPEAPKPSISQRQLPYQAPAVLLRRKKEGLARAAWRNHAHAFLSTAPISNITLLLQSIVLSQGTRKHARCAWLHFPNGVSETKSR